MTRSPGRSPCSAPGLFCGTSVMTTPFAASGKRELLAQLGRDLAELEAERIDARRRFRLFRFGRRRCRTVRVQRRDLELDLLLLAVPPHRQLDRRLGRRIGHQPRQLSAAVDRLAVIGEDHVSRLQLCLRRGARRIDRRDHRPASLVEPDGLGNLVGDRLDAGADPAAFHFAGSPATAR